MNYIVIGTYIYISFYLMYVFYETYNTKYHIDMKLLNHYLAAGMLCAVMIFLIPSLFTIILICFLLVCPMFLYRKVEYFGKQIREWYMLLLSSYGVMLILKYFGSIIPVIKCHYNYQLDLLFLVICTIVILLHLSKVKMLNAYPYTLMINLCCIIIGFVLFRYYGKFHDFALLIPMSMIILCIGLFRICYTMEESNQNVLKLTIQRYAEKENKAKYELLEKENKIIMQQMHDMKKQLQIIENMQDDKEKLHQYKQDIEDKAEEILYMKQTRDPLINQILRTYYPRFQMAHIQCNIEVDEIDFHFMDTVDLGALLANMLDNAIESCEKCKERFLLLKIKQQKGIIIFKMKNSCNMIVEKNGSIQSSKKDALYHGYGMRNMAMIAHKYAGELTYEFDEEHHIFITSVSLFADHM